MKLLYPCGSFRVDSCNVVRDGVVIDACAFEVHCMPHVMTLVPVCVPLKLNCLFLRPFWVLKDQKGGYHLSFYQSENRYHVSGQTLSHHSFLSIPWIWVLVANDPAEGNAFDITGCLQQLSGLVASPSMHRSWFLWGLTGFSTVPPLM